LEKTPLFRRADALKMFSQAPLLFFGLGIYRAWIELAYVRPPVVSPSFVLAGHNVYDLSMVVVLIVCALFARKLAPLYRKKSLLTICLITMTGGTFLNYFSYFVPFALPPVAYGAAVSAGVGTALIILLWSELYGCLNPFKVAFYYSGSLLFAGLIIFIFKGFTAAYLFGGVLILPLLTLICVRASYRSVEPENLPQKTWSSFTFPWKPTVLMAVYGFAYGMRENQLYEYLGPHSSIGALVAAAVVFVGVLFVSKRFDFTVIYRIALPVMVGGLLLVPSISPLRAEFSAECVSMSYTSFSILVMLIFCNITYRFGIGAVWLFGIERGLRALFMFFGRETSAALSNGFLSSFLQTATFNIVIVILVVVMTLILLSERDLSSRWGITFLGAGKADAKDTEQQRLALVCSDISKRFNLSPREEEVLLLLARRRELGYIEKELFIANGTAKAHIRHIYGKLNIHRRSDLYEMLGLTE
jgi:DNA-binding CsgD family transcriptional regulator